MDHVYVVSRHRWRKIKPKYLRSELNGIFVKLMVIEPDLVYKKCDIFATHPQFDLFVRLARNVLVIVRIALLKNHHEIITSRRVKIALLIQQRIFIYALHFARAISLQFSVLMLLYRIE